MLAGDDDWPFGRQRSVWMGCRAGGQAAEAEAAGVLFEILEL